MDKVPAELLNPVKAWPSKESFDAQSVKLAGMFATAFERYSADCAPEGKLAFLLAFPLSCREVQKLIYIFSFSSRCCWTCFLI